MSLNGDQLEILLSVFSHSSIKFVYAKWAANISNTYTYQNNELFFNHRNHIYFKRDLGSTSYENVLTW